MSNIKVSVVMLAYNHGKYIEKALRSVAEQITNFEFEVIIGDDASPDNTQELIKKVYQEYPNIIKPVLRDRNLGIMKNAIDLIKRCQGKYIAILEGDDFWISSDKLQKQVDFLESNQEYVAYYHKNSIVDDESNIVCEKDTEFCDHTEYTIDDFSQFLLPGQSGTVIMRKYILDKVLSDKNTLSILKHIKFTPADRILALYLISIGKVYCGDEVMSAYRSVIKKEEQTGGPNMAVMIEKQVYTL